jgi:uncharacterized protein (DUF2147 family)
MTFYGRCSATIIVCAFVSLSAFVCGPAHADPRGLWQAQDGAIVKIGPCGRALCATIATPKSRVDPATGQPWTDKNNPDPSQRGRPLIGVAVLSGLVPDGPGKWSGQLYNIDNGQSYTGHLVEIDRGTVRVEGCVIGLCGGRNMSRLR